MLDWAQLIPWFAYQSQRNISALVVSLMISLLLPQNLNAAELSVKSEANDRGNRWEGYASSTVSTRFRLLSATVGTFPKYQQEDNLFIEFNRPDNHMNLSISANTLNPTAKYYAMEVKQKQWPEMQKRFGPWPVNDFLIPESIPAQNMGLLIKAENSTIFPAKIIIETDQQKQPQPYHFFFYTPDDIATLYWQVNNLDGTATLVAGESKDHWPNDVILIRVNMSGHDVGLYQLNLKINWGDGTSPLQYHFYHGG